MQFCGGAGKGGDEAACEFLPAKVQIQVARQVISSVIENFSGRFVVNNLRLAILN